MLIGKGWQKNQRAIPVAEQAMLANIGRTVVCTDTRAVVDAAKAAAKQYVDIVVVSDAEPSDESHALVRGYEAYNDQVAEELAGIVIATYSANP